MSKIVRRSACGILLAVILLLCLSAAWAEMGLVDDVMAPPDPNALGMTEEYEVLDGIPNTDRPLGLPQCERVDDSYFDDAVFVGDSVSVKLEYYVRAMRRENPNFLGKAQFLTAGSMGSGNMLYHVSEKSLHPSYQGVKMQLEDAILACGAKKVYIMLGMNDVYVYGREKSIENYDTLIGRIREKSPDTVIIIESVTPRIKGYDKAPTTKHLFDYDLTLYDYVLEHRDDKIYFVDVAYAIRDENGDLPREYCSDATGMGIHFTDEGCAAWVEYLYTHALQ